MRNLSVFYFSFMLSVMKQLSGWNMYEIAILIFRKERRVFCQDLINLEERLIDS